MKDLREKCEKLNRFIADAYPNYYGVVKDLPNGDREYQPFKAKEYDEFIVSQLEAFALEIASHARLKALEEAASILENPPYYWTGPASTVRTIKDLHTLAAAAKEE